MSTLIIKGHETEDFAEYIQEMAHRMNLELNFVKNSDLHLGNYSVALKDLAPLKLKTTTLCLLFSFKVL